MTGFLIASVLAAAVLTTALVRRLRRRDAARGRMLTEDALKHLFDQQYRGRFGSFASLGGMLRLDDRRLMRLLERMQQQGLVIADGQEFRLTAEGERVARQVVRAHRLLERYFADEARLPLKQVHAAAEVREHALTPDQIDELSASLGHPRLDPHGDPIPGRDGQIAPAGDVPVTAWQTGGFGRIVHLEDEPPLAYAQILAEGLHVGQIVRILESTPGRVVSRTTTGWRRPSPPTSSSLPRRIPPRRTSSRSRIFRTGRRRWSCLSTPAARGSAGAG
jgi:Mn-dependent DtxR family transcriptional regulator